MYMCANTPAFSPLVYSERVHDLKFLLPVNVQSPQPLRRHIPHTNVYYQVIYALYA